ncbi:MAG: FG-GAP-like repeat-containing protein, partial [Syntrophothermus sp.]
GKNLDAYFEKSAGKKFLIAVNDADARYPVTIDPVSISPDWMATGGQKEAYFGQRLASAGDVNGDGFGDVIIGANSYDNGQTDEGKVYLYYGTASGLSATPAWTAEGNQESALFGHVVASAGDVNKDGYSDVIIAAPGYSNGQSGEGRVFVYYGSASGLPANANWTGESNLADAYYGNSAASAGDVNNDGYSDIIVGAPYYSPSMFKPQTGRVYVYYGSASGLSGTASWTKDGATYYHMLGFSASSAGDVNKDGYSDIIVSAPGYGSGQTYEGITYLYLGKSTGLSTTAAWNYESNRDTAGFGFCVAPAGDINNDGFADVIVGVPDYSNGQPGEGAAYIFYGQSSGLSSTPTWFKESNIEKSSFGYSVASAGDVNHDGFNDILIGSPNYANGNVVEGAAYLFYGTASGLSATAGWIIESNQDSASLGYCVASGGDINKDGIKDILIGAPAYNGGIAREGEALVYYGSNSGPLPVELVSFSAELQGRDILLKWQTATEVNNFGFEIERCRLNSENRDYQNTAGPDIRDWKKAGFVRGAGNSNSRRNYTFTDIRPEAGKYLYRLKQIDNDGKVEYPADLEVAVNEERGFELMQNNPNPCNPSARIEYSIPVKVQVTLKLYNAAGQEVAILVNEEKSPGHYQYYFNGSRLPSGLYIYSLNAGRYSAAKKMIIIK